MKNFMEKYGKIIMMCILTAASIAAIVLLSILLANKFGIIADYMADTGLPNRDEIIGTATRDIIGLFIANITLFAWIVKSWFFICWKFFKKKEK